MSESENKQDQLEKMLDKWSRQLPEAPAQLVTETLNQIQVSQNPNRRNWFSLAVLGGMVAASLVVAVGLVVLVGGDKSANLPATQVAAVAVATPTVEKAEVANPVNTTGTTGVIPAFTAAPELSPTATAPAPTSSTPDTNQPTIVLTGPTPAALGTTDTTNQSTGAPVNTQAQPEAIPTHTVASAPAVTTAARATIAPVEPTGAPASTQTKNPGGPIAIRAPEDESPIPPPTTLPGTVRLTGRIVTLESSDLILSTDPERIYFNASTTVTLSGQVSTIGSLKVSQNVTILATRNAQGQLVASSIAITPSGPKKG